MSQVFLSYAREDTAWTRTLRDELAARGVSCWIDESDIPVSVPWMSEIEEGIADALLFVGVASEHWRESTACGIERDLADKTLTRTTMVGTDQPVAAAASVIERELGEVEPWEVERISVSRRSRAWAGSGRRRGALARGRSLRNARRILRRHLRQLDPVSRSYLEASERRRRRLVFAAVVTSVVLVFLIGVPAVASRFNEIADQRFAAANRNLADQAAQQEEIEYDPYLGLAAVADDRSSGYATHAQRARALAVAVPTSVRDAAGVTGWSSSRTAVSADGDRTAEVAANGTRVVVRDRNGAVVRSMRSTAPGIALSWSPDGATIAVIEQHAVEVLRVSDGVSLRALRGAVGSLDAVVWQRDSRHVLARNDADRAFAWTVFDGTRIAGRDTSGYLRIAYLSSGRTAAVAGNGDIVVFNTAGVAQQRIRPPVNPDLVTAGASDGHRVAGLAVVGYTTGVFIWDSSTGRKIWKHDVGCDASDLAFAGERVIVTCTDDHLASINLKTGTEQVVKSDDRWLSVTVSGSHIYLGSTSGDVAEASADLRTHTTVGSVACGAPIRLVLAAGHKVFGFGTDSSAIGCTSVSKVSGTGPPRTGIAPPVDSRYCVAAAARPDGRVLALGCDDGAVYVYGSNDLQPHWYGQATSGPIRSVTFAGSDALLVATRDGQITRVDLPGLSDAARRASAAAEVARAERLGLYRPRS